MKFFNSSWILLCMDEICYMCSLPMWGCNEKPIDKWIIYHTTWRMKLFMNGNGMLLENFLFGWNWQYGMLKGITWMKANDMDEINPIIILFQNFILFLKQNQCDTKKKQYIFPFFVFHSLGYSLLWVVVLVWFVH